MKRIRRAISEGFEFIFAVVFVIFVSCTGCVSTGRPEVVGGMNLEQQMEAYIDDYLDQVLDKCIQLHGMAGSGESPVDCAFQGDLSAMHLSLPSIAYHNDHFEQIMLLEHHWCASAQTKTGKPARWVRHFRREKRIVSRPCYTGAELRRLLRYGEEREARQN
ncbi:hypothetical protein LCGC14_2276070 [marine sediment metagenome]|uniref:Uncharacterized protein n=1 Tax=marine sediment metagenome TaxID=412755 RepID=A0A0F9FQS0_9ZZZZ